MPKIIATMWVTLDGFVAGLDDGMDWVRLDEQMMAYEQALVEAADILMLGRVTFGDFAGHWPHLANEPEPEFGDPSSLDAMHRAYARRIDSMRKIVVSASGNVVEWRNSETLLTIGKIDIDRLNREAKGDIVIYGSVSVINALSALDLIDEYHLLVHPIALGNGRPLFDSLVKLELESAEPFKSGIVLAKYRQAKGPLLQP
jgi:dihydrofolate reductase|tara:strand:- start:1168 stop:1770 length:603 start_codon:yes stop_codon:yes gene_type:complete